jgi:hypothetical protein
MRLCVLILRFFRQCRIRSGFGVVVEMGLLLRAIGRFPDTPHSGHVNTPALGRSAVGVVPVEKLGSG